MKEENKLYYLCDLEEAKKRIENREVKVAVIGQGKLGLALSASLLYRGFAVYGVDNSPRVLNMINQGTFKSNDTGVANTIFKELGNAYAITDDIERAIKLVDIIIITIPLDIENGITGTRLKGMNAFEDLIENITEVMRRGQLIIIETTMPPSITRDRIKPMLDKTYTVGKDIGLAYSPERVFSGRAMMDIIRNYPKIVSGATDRCLEMTALFYNSICEKGTILMSSTTAAECVKVFKGIYRDVNIALTQELGNLTDKLGVDLDEVIDAANTEPACHIHRRGTGVGGHCIPVYPHFAIMVASGLDNLLLPMTWMGRRINEDTPMHVSRKIINKLIKMGKNPSKSCVALLGLSYRANVKEHRNSPTIEIAKELKFKDIIVHIHDPYYTPIEIKEIVPQSDEWIMPLEKLNKCDLVVVLARHEEYENILPKLSNVFDLTMSLGDYTVTQKDRKIKTGDYLND